MAVVGAVAVVGMAVVGAAAVVGMAVVGEAVAGGHQRSSVGPSLVGSSGVRWLLRIMPVLVRTMRRRMDRHRAMGRGGGGVTSRSRITPTHRLAPAGFEPFNHSKTRPKLALTTFWEVFRLKPGGTPTGASQSSALGRRVCRRGSRAPAVFKHFLSESPAGAGTASSLSTPYLLSPGRFMRAAQQAARDAERPFPPDQARNPA